jgi:histidine triad (HIT) family protein
MPRRDWYCEDVLSGKMKVDVLYEDERVLGFRHPFPDTRAGFHGVIVPKHHVRSAMSVEAADGKLLESLMKAVQKIASATGIDKNGDGFYVSFNAESEGVTPHMHWHVRAPIPPGK